MDKPIKIKALWDKNQASHYHRVWLPMTELSKDSAFDIELIDGRVVTDDTCKDADIIFYAWAVQNRPCELSVFKSKYGVKFVHEIDDFWEYSPLHLTYNSPEKRMASAQDVTSKLFE